LNLKKTKLLLFSLIVTAVFAAILLPMLDKVRAVTVLRDTRPGFILLSFLAYAAAFFFRALRFKRLIFTRDISLKTLIPVSWAHTLMVKLLPSYTGELSYVYLLKGRKIRAGEAVFSLLVVRILDAFFIFSFFVVSFIFVKSQLPGKAIALGWIGWAGFLILLWLIFQKNSFKISLKKHLGNQRIRKYSFGRFVADKLIETGNNFSLLKEKRLLPGMLVLSLALFFINLLSAYFMLYSINIRLPVENLIFICSLSWIVSIIPLKGICNFGNFEGIWALSFFLLSMGADNGIIAGLYVHLLIICFSLLLGLTGFGLLSRSRG
jgi:uncharacterized protein (TIRG00374 family)